MEIAALRPDADIRRIDQARVLLEEYYEFARGSTGTGFRMGKLEREIADLPHSYAPDLGLLLIATDAGEAAGCVGYRPLPEITHEQAAEVKRLWVRPAFRGTGLAKNLMLRLINEAEALGFAALYLDTEIDRMAGALKLYRSLGFTDCTPFRESNDAIVFLRRNIGT
jgi:ribosomal protein S18 acetylase RimI-like enzyme